MSMSYSPLPFVACVAVAGQLYFLLYFNLLYDCSVEMFHFISQKV